MNSQVVLLTGASGFIGSRVLEALRRRNHAVRCLVRKHLPSSSATEMIVGDITDPVACNEAVRGVTAVIHAAGEKSQGSRYEAVNTEGTRNLLEAARLNGVSRFIHLSSVGVIGADPFRRRVYDEKSPCHPSNPYERSKWRAEKYVLKSAAEGMSVAVLRPANVFGDRDPAQGLLTLAQTVRKERFIFIGSRTSLCNFVFVDDVAEAASFLVDHAPDATAEPIYHLDDTCTIGEFVDALSNELEIDTPAFQIPVPLVHILRSGLKTARLIPAVSNRTLFARIVSLNNQASFKSSRLADEIGFQYPVGWRRGVSRLIRWYRDQGDL